MLLHVWRPDAVLIYLIATYVIGYSMAFATLPIYYTLMYHTEHFKKQIRKETLH